MGTVMKRMMSRVWIMMMPSFSVFRRFSSAKVLNPGGEGGRDSEVGATHGLAPLETSSQQLTWVLQTTASSTMGPLPGGRLWMAPRSPGAPSTPTPLPAGGRAPHPPMTRSSLPQPVSGDPSERRC